MAKNDFDIDFDFDKENSFDPVMPMDGNPADPYGYGQDYDPLQDDQLGTAQGYGDDYSVEDFLNYNVDGDYGYDPNAPYVPYTEGQDDDPAGYDNQAGYDDQAGYDNQAGYDDQAGYDEQAGYDDQAGYDEQAGYDDQVGYDDQAAYDDRDGYDDEGTYDDPEVGEDEAAYEEEPGAYQDAREESDEELPEDAQDYEDEYEEEKPRKERKKITLPKIHFHMPQFFGKFIGIYFGPMIAEMSGTAPQPEGRRRKSKTRIFKEVYLPPLVLCVSLILVISCVAGSISTAVKGKKVRDEQNRKESIASAEAAEQAQQENAAVLQQAEAYAMQYDYEKAVEILESYGADAPKEVQEKKAEYVQAQSRLVEWKDPAGIPNLSFQLLIADPPRAFANAELGGKYNQNFVTTDEFQRILEALYGGNYVLVDFDSFVEVSEDLEGGLESFMGKPIYLPEGKKPVMITETMVNYYSYMIDGNKDGEPDKDGSGFASRLVVDGAGDIKAEMVDASGNTVVGDYDLVPILESFLKLHPDFSYQGAKAVLAVTGEEGIFGYRINTSVISDPKRGQAYYEQQVAGATELVEALRNKGYTLASYTYGNRNYGQDNANQIQEDMQKWNDQITPVLGPVNVMVFARESDIGNYTDTKYKALYDKGFRIFVGKSDEPFADITNAYVRQKRLMVNGVNMTFNPGMFTGLFDCGAVKNSQRPEVINPKK